MSTITIYNWEGNGFNVPDYHINRFYALSDKIENAKRDSNIELFRGYSILFYSEFGKYRVSKKYRMRIRLCILKTLVKLCLN